MVVFKVILTLTTLFSVAFCDDPVVSIKLSFPHIKSTLTTIDQALRTLQGSDMDLMGGTKLAENLLIKVKQNIFEYIGSMLWVLRRTALMNPRPHVMLAPGVSKTEIIKYPKNYFENRLKSLLQIKQKHEERNKG